MVASLSNRFITIAELHSEIGNYSKAVQFLKKAVKADPASLRSRANELVEIGDYQNAYLYYITLGDVAGQKVCKSSDIKLRCAGCKHPILSTPVYCPHCQTAHCSETCRQRFWDGFHERMCNKTGLDVLKDISQLTGVSDERAVYLTDLLVRQHPDKFLLPSLVYSNILFQAANSTGSFAINAIFSQKKRLTTKQEMLDRFHELVRAVSSHVPHNSLRNFITFLDPSDVTVSSEELQSGSNGKIYIGIVQRDLNCLAHKIPAGSKVACKTFILSQDWDSLVKEAAFQHCVNVETRMVPQIYALMMKDKKLYIVMEFVNGEPLENFVPHWRKDQTQGTCAKKVKTMKQILDVCLMQRIIGLEHRDLHTGNIMYDECTGFIKVIDFGNISKGEAYNDEVQIIELWKRFFPDDGIVPNDIYDLRLVRASQWFSTHKKGKWTVKDWYEILSIFAGDIELNHRLAAREYFHDTSEVFTKSKEWTTAEIQQVADSERIAAGKKLNENEMAFYSLLHKM